MVVDRVEKKRNHTYGIKVYTYLTVEQKKNYITVVTDIDIIQMRVENFILDVIFNVPNDNLKLLLEISIKSPSSWKKIIKILSKEKKKETFFKYIISNNYL